jgi:hypothetical protein
MKAEEDVYKILSDLDFSPHLSFTFAPQNAELVKSHLFIL